MSDAIISPSNPLARRILKLEADPDARRKEGCFLLWGSRLVEEGLKDRARVDHLVLGERASRRPALRPLLRRVRQQQIPQSVLSDSLLDRLVPGAGDQGLLAIMRFSIAPLEHALGALKTPLVLVADRIQDPGNVGTLVRLGEAASIAALVIVPGTADPHHTRAVRASAGSILRVPLCAALPFEDWKRVSLARRIRTVATLSQGGVAPDRADLRGPLALVVGNEGEGVSKDWVEAADLRVTVGLGGSVQSLNVAAAAAILLYEAFRQRQG
ncbi:MAG TPA: RNA methyltransferase [Candidatus Polarisedimenticolia bacterium]|nr:RNA methyltransferase [Candidatus Polarisedimenticolia bacterium]